jgi:DNA polymerase-3 subunit epsilon
VAVILQDLDTGAERFRFVRRLNPLMHITAKATAVHGMTDADVMGCPTFAQVAPLLVTLFEKVDFLVGHNLEGFDNVMLLYEFQRVGITTLARLPTVIDTMLLGRSTTPDGKVPTLGELCWALDVPYDPAQAHAALYDVSCTLQAFRNGVKLGVFELPTVTAALAA